MKIYTGISVNEQKVVHVRYAGGSKVSLPQHFKHKGEDRFDWGKDNAESLNTAFSILANAFGNEFCDKIDCFCYVDWIMDYYEDFNREVLAKFNSGFWKLTQSEICDWIFDRTAKIRESKKFKIEEELVTTS